MKHIKKYADVLINMVYGCIIGVANIIPGVSGGTMAVMLNIYDKLIDAFTGLRKNLKKSISLLLPVLIGAGLGIVAFSVFIKYLITNHPLPTCFFFIGLILGSLPLIIKKALETKFRLYSILPMVVFLAAMTMLAFVNTEGSSSGSLTINAVNWFYLLISAVVAAMCMIIPGVSGSMILMVFGVYSTVISAISGLTHHFVDSCIILFPVGIGVILGLLFGAKLIDICIKKLPQQTYFAIIGLMLGSPLVIFMKFKAEDHAMAIKDPSFVSNFVYSPVNIGISVFVFLVGMAIAAVFGSEKLKAHFAGNNTSSSGGKTPSGKNRSSAVKSTSGKSNGSRKDTRVKK